MYVIASQCAHWRGNPHPLTHSNDENAKRRTDCHTSDIGHWFAMTGFSTVYFPTQKRSKILAVMSSRTVAPVTSPMASMASSISMSTMSGVSP